MKVLLIAFMISLIMTGCGTETNEITCTDIRVTSTCISAEQKVEDMKNIRIATVETLNALKTQDIDKLSKAMSKDGIRFSPYSNVDIANDVVLKEDTLRELVKNNNKIVWGSLDGLDDPISLSFSEYWSKFIYDDKFLTEGIPYINTRVQRGSVKNNVYDVYRGDMIIEYYIPGTSTLYEGMDRKSLTIVLTKEDGLRKVKAIIHGQWTI